MTAVSIELPDEPGWSTVSVGGIRACAGGTPRPTDRGSRLTGSVESRPQGEVGEVHTVQVNDQEFHRVDVSWVDPQFGTIRQIHAFASLQREVHPHHPLTRTRADAAYRGAPPARRGRCPVGCARPERAWVSALRCRR